MSETRVVHVNDNVPDAVYIGRAVPRLKMRMSELANPYRIGANNALLGGQVLTREEAVNMYRHELQFGTMRRLLATALPGLRGKPLACWCRHDGESLTPGTLCHGDVIVDFLERFGDDALRSMGEEREE